MGAKIGGILLVVVVIGVGLYIFGSGAIQNGYNALQNLGHSSSTPYVAPSGGYVPPVTTPTIISPAPPPYTTPTNIPQGFTASQLSPYYGQVRFGGISYGAAYTNSYGQITLYSYPTVGTSSIDITGWKIQSNHGGEFIPQAVNLYDPSGLAAPSDIRLKYGDVAYLYSTSAPVNLRLNECVGYLQASVSQFTPALPETCPAVDRSQLSQFSGACQNYINSLSTCQAPNLNNPSFPQTDYACQQYLSNNFNYHSCFDAHEADPNFLSNEVWVWMGSNATDPFHDRVLLLDKNGLLVDIYTY